MNESDDVCCSPAQVASIGVPLDVTWTAWIARTAAERGVAVVGAIRGPDGWVEVDGQSLCALVPSWSTATTTQRAGCRGTSTKLVVDAGRGPIGVLFVDRMRLGYEDPRWRSLLLEALVLDRRTTPAEVSALT